MSTRISGPSDDPVAPATTEPSSVRHYLAFVRRRKFVILQAAILVCVVTLLLSLQQEKRYRAGAEVLLSSQNLATQLTGTQAPASVVPPDRIAQTQAEVARAPRIFERVLKDVPSSGLNVTQFAHSSSVAPAVNADILTFSVTNTIPRTARNLANAYARQYTIFRRQLDIASINASLAQLNGRLKELGDKPGGRDTPLYERLIDRQQTLSTMAALQTSNAVVLREAGGTTQVQPQLVRNVVLAVVVGLLFGVLLALLLDSVDTRVRSSSDVIQAMAGLSLLGHLRAPTRKLATNHRLVMLEQPASSGAEAFRILRTSLEFSMLSGDLRSILVTSALPEEGKSTTAANLAVALARSGRSVVLVDLDLTRPAMADFFRISGPGLTDVILGHVPLQDALTPIEIPGALADEGLTLPRGGSRNGAKSSGLSVLTAGAIPPNASEFVATIAVGQTITALKEQFDVVLIDSPPVLGRSDTLILCRYVDGVVVLANLQLARRGTIAELLRQLSTTPARIVGFILTGSDPHGTSSYGYHAGQGSFQGSLSAESPEQAGQGRVR